nr:MAG TPA: hypothetical protein [Caudoviricetes sp.]
MVAVAKLYALATRRFLNLLIVIYYHFKVIMSILFIILK